MRLESDDYPIRPVFSSSTPSQTPRLSPLRAPAPRRPALTDTRPTRTYCTPRPKRVDRAHRIGQHRPVKVVRLSITGTVEERILALQEKKRQIAAATLGDEHEGGPGAGGGRRRGGPRLTDGELQTLFGG